MKPSRKRQQQRCPAGTGRKFHIETNEQDVEKQFECRLPKTLNIAEITSSAFHYQLVQAGGSVIGEIRIRLRAMIESRRLMRRTARMSTSRYREICEHPHAIIDDRGHLKPRLECQRDFLALEHSWSEHRATEAGRLASSRT